MKNHYSRCDGWLLLVLSGLLLLACTSASAQDNVATVLADLPLPPGASLTPVSSSAVHNGVPQAIAVFTSTNSVDSVLQFYRKRWATRTDEPVPGYVESQFAPWYLISQLRDGYNIVVQVNGGQNDNFATGFISVRAVNAPSRLVEHGVFVDLDMLSSNHSIDGVDESSMRVYASGLSVAKSHSRYREKLLREGWQVLGEDSVQRNRVLVLSLRQSRLELTFMPSQSYASVVVVHKVTSQ